MSRSTHARCIRSRRIAWTLPVSQKRFSRRYDRVRTIHHPRRHCSTQSNDARMGYTSLVGDICHAFVRDTLLPTRDCRRALCSRINRNMALRLSCPAAMAIPRVVRHIRGTFDRCRPHPPQKPRNRSPRQHDRRRSGRRRTSGIYAVL